MTDNKLQSATDNKVFKPTPHMIVWLDTAMKLKTDVIDEISRVSGIEESTWYRWIKDDQFRLWYKAEWDRRLAIFGPQLDAIGLKNAKRDFKYWETMQKRVGNLQEGPKSLQQFNVTGEMKLEFTGDES